VGDPNRKGSISKRSTRISRLETVGAVAVGGAFGVLDGEFNLLAKPFVPAAVRVYLGSAGLCLARRFAKPPRRTGSAYIGVRFEGAFCEFDPVI
jgi:hypothetical protein